MPNHRMNKAMAGYHILMILSAVDFHFHIAEEKIIREFMFQEFPFNLNLDREMDVISKLKHDEWMPHFIKCVEDFLDDSTLEERNDFLKFAVYLAKADQVITKVENDYLQILFDAWDFHLE